MPKLVIDYSNTIIYKIFCNDPNVKHLYVGHTTNFVQRKHAHKQNCTNSNSICYDFKVYKMIRSNGGWDNWTMEIVNFFKCKDNYEARKKEQEYFVLLNATLNSSEPLPYPKVSQNSDTLTDKKNNVKQLFYCKKCNIIFSTEKLLNLHNSTKKHNMDINLLLQPKNPGNPPTYVCDYSDYNTSNKKDFKKHNLTKKHIYNKDNKSTTQTTSHHNTGYACVCVCGKSYNHRASLYNHKKKCIMCKEGGNKTIDKSVNNGLLEDSFGDGMGDGINAHQCLLDTRMDQMFCTDQ
jgi:hypothetical protein